MKSKRYAKGTDSVPAMLTPREAILNRNAAELLGRDTIKRLNDHGNMLSKRGVDLASLPSDPTPGPSTENMLGYQTGTADVRRDDRGDLLRDAENTFYGGGHVPAPSPTPKPVRGYAYGTDDVLDQNDYPNAASRVRPRTVTSTMANSFYSGRGGTPLGPQYDPSTGFQNPRPSGTVGLRGSGDTNISGSTYIGRNGVDLGPQYGNQGQLNPKPAGAIGLQGSLPQTTAQQALSNFNRPMTHTEMAADIAKRNLTASGSQLGTPQQNTPLPAGVNQNITPEQARDMGLQWTGGNVGWQPYISPQQMTDQNLQYTGGSNIPSQNGTTTHFLPPGFTTTTGSTGAPNSSPNDIHFLPPGFTSVQGAVNATTKQLQEPDQGYGSAYGY